MYRDHPASAGLLGERRISGSHALEARKQPTDKIRPRPLC